MLARLYKSKVNRFYHSKTPFLMHCGAVTHIFLWLIASFCSKNFLNPLQLNCLLCHAGKNALSPEACRPSVSLLQKRAETRHYFSHQ